MTTLFMLVHKYELRQNINKLHVQDLLCICMKPTLVVIALGHHMNISQNVFQLWAFVFRLVLNQSPLLFFDTLFCHSLADFHYSATILTIVQDILFPC